MPRPPLASNRRSTARTQRSVDLAQELEQQLEPPQPEPFSRNPRFLEVAPGARVDFPVGVLRDVVREVAITTSAAGI